MSSNYSDFTAQISQITSLIRSGVFFIVVFFLTLVVLRVIWTARRQKRTKKLPPTALKTCPDCAEQVQMAARICRYCRHDFSAWPASVAPPLNTTAGPTGAAIPSPYGWPAENQGPIQNADPK
jgi:preprotein translocase subunit SecG